MELRYDSLAALSAAAEESGVPLSSLVLRQQALQMEQSEEALYETMHASYEVMRSAVHQGLQPGVRSTSGLTGGSAFRLNEHLQHHQSLTGGLLPTALAKALAVSEWNAAMGRIVASPTAGSCGILPAALLTVQEARGLEDRACVMSLFTASAIGMVIARNASISGAEGGCQAECGTASAMAAAALCELCGGTPRQGEHAVAIALKNNASISGAEGGCQAECGTASAMAAAALCELCGGTPRQGEHAVAIALKNILGLVCDPVAGLVEIPCEKRNASGVANAFVAAELALAGVESAIPADEVVLAMKRVGDSLPAALRETAEGGLAATPTAQSLYQMVFGNQAPAASGCAGCRACRT